MEQIKKLVWFNGTLARIRAWVVPNATYFTVGFYMFLTFVLPIRRIMMDWGNSDQVTFIGSLFQLQFGVSIMLVVPLAILLEYPQSKFTRGVTVVFNREFVNLLCFLALGCCIFLTVTQVAGFWWTWITLGLYFCLILLVMKMSEDRLPPTIAAILGVGMVCIIVGCWEIPYQAGIKFIYDLPQVGLNMVVQPFIREILLEVPLVLGGVLILYLIQRRYKVMRANTICYLLLLAAGSAYVMWFITGFWVDVWFDWTTRTWIYTDYNYKAMVIYKSSKVWLCLAFAALLLKGGKEK